MDYKAYIEKLNTQIEDLKQSVRKNEIPISDATYLRKCVQMQISFCTGKLAEIELLK